MSYSDMEARRMVEAVKRLHFEYLPVHVEFTVCAHCNSLCEFPRVQPWPCPTVLAMTTAILNSELAFGD